MACRAGRESWTDDGGCSLAEVYVAEGRWDELGPLLDGLPPAAPETVLLCARLHLARREFGRVQQLLEEVLARSPRSLDVRVLLSYAYLQEGRDPAAAERALLAVLELDPDNAEAKRNLTLLRRSLLPRDVERRAASADGIRRCGQVVRVSLGLALAGPTQGAPSICRLRVERRSFWRYTDRASSMKAGPKSPPCSQTRKPSSLSHKLR